MVEILKQDQYVPMDVSKQVAIIFAAANGLLDDVDTDKVKFFEAGLLESLENQHSGLLDEITKEGKISENLEKSLLSAIKDFKKGFSN